MPQFAVVAASKVYNIAISAVHAEIDDAGGIPPSRTPMDLRGSFHTALSELRSIHQETGTKPSAAFSDKPEEQLAKDLAGAYKGARVMDDLTPNDVKSALREVIGARSLKVNERGSESEVIACKQLMGEVMSQLQQWGVSDRMRASPLKFPRFWQYVSEFCSENAEVRIFGRGSRYETASLKISPT